MANNLPLDINGYKKLITANNLPFDINSYKKFIIDNFLKSNQPKGKIGGGGFSQARKVNVKSIGTKGGSTIDDALNILFGNSAKAGAGSVAEELGGVAKKLVPFGNPYVMGAMNLPIAIQNMKDIYGGEASKRNYEWAKEQMAKRGITPALQAKPKPIAKTQTSQPKLKQVNVKPIANSKAGGLPPLPSVAPVGSYPTYQQILKDAGVPIMNNYNPSSPSQANEYALQQGVGAQTIPQNLAQRLGLGGYVEPNVPAGTELSTERLQQIRDYLSKYSPEEYRGVIDTDAMNTLRNKSFANMFKNPALGEIPSELQRQGDVLKYLQQGYDVDMGLATTARKLAQSEALSKATGLPSTWFEEPKDVLSNIVRPQITSQGQIEAYKQLGANQLRLGNLNNATKIAIAKMVNQLGQQKLANQMELAKMYQQGKIAPAMIQALGDGMVGGQQLLNFVNQLDNPNLIPSQTTFDKTDRF